MEALASTWTDLAPHFARGAMWLVSEDLDLVVVGRAFADDDTETVSAWLEGGSIRRPTDHEAEGWAMHPPAFQVVIVQPWVLATIP